METERQTRVDPYATTMKSSSTTTATVKKNCHKNKVTITAKEATKGKILYRPVYQYYCFRLLTFRKEVVYQRKHHKA